MGVSDSCLDGKVAITGQRNAINSFAPIMWHDHAALIGIWQRTLVIKKRREKSPAADPLYTLRPSRCLVVSLLGGNRNHLTTNCENPQLRNGQLPDKAVTFCGSALSCPYYWILRYFSFTTFWKAIQRLFAQRTQIVRTQFLKYVPLLVCS